MGNLYFKAPETIGFDKIYVQQSDVWSIGVIMYLLLTGKYPFKGADDMEVK